MDVVYAKGSAVVMTPDGGRWTVGGGEHWPAGDPVVQARPDLFSSDSRYGMRYSSEPAGMSEPPVEEVTARPGERRGSVRRG